MYIGPDLLPERATAYFQAHENFLELLAFVDNLIVLDEEPVPAECL